jgi:primosomal protein N''
VSLLANTPEDDREALYAFLAELLLAALAEEAAEEEKRNSDKDAT